MCVEPVNGSRRQLTDAMGVPNLWTRFKREGSVFLSVLYSVFIQCVFSVFYVVFYVVLLSVLLSHISIILSHCIS